MGHPLASHRLSIDEFVAWENLQPERHEFLAGEVFATTGAKDAHNTIAGNIFVALRTMLRGSPCRAFIADMKLRVEAADAVFYPDLMACCDPSDLAPAAAVEKRHPRLLVEVLSESTAAYDRGEKFRHYRTLAELQEVVFVEQDRIGVDVFRRGADGHWVLHPYAAGETVEFASVGIHLDIAAIYEDVALGADRSG